jgi:hypothetical protein
MPVIRSVVLAAGLLVVLTSSAVAQALSIRLTGIPPRLGFPLPAGTNLVLTAQVSGGSAREVWLARKRDARLRIHLTRVAEGRYQINLADPEVAPALTARGRTGRFQVFARAPGGQIFASIPVQFGTVGSGKVTARGSIRSGGKWRAIPSESWRKTWVAPAAVEAIEIKFTGYPPAPHARAEIGKVHVPFSGDPGGLRFVLSPSPEVRRLWQAHGVLRILHGKDASERKVLVLHAIPDRPARPEEAACLTVVQRRTREIPGWRGYLRLHLGDITRGQVVIEVHAGSASVVRRRSVRPGDRVAFQVGGRSYHLLVASLVNFLIGNDYGIFVAYEKRVPEAAKIEALIAMVRHAPVLFYEGDAKRTQAWMERHLRDSLRAWSAKHKTLEDFILRVAGPHADRTFAVRSPGAEKTGLREWLEEQAAVFDPKAKLARKEV